MPNVYRSGSKCKPCVLTVSLNFWLKPMLMLLKPMLMWLKPMLMLMWLNAFTSRAPFGGPIYLEFV